ncbi:MAG: leucine-rich repeat domain-containing protein, partial [Kiritimatiellae bacterium]|nr:leucine-rich repeat domain-containing protein [Kiritimatiellia bacterium]
MKVMRFFQWGAGSASLRAHNRMCHAGALSLALLLAAASHAQALQSGDFLYSTNAVGEASITGYAGAGGDLVIPPTLNGASVVDIAKDAFCWKPLTSVRMAGSITNIGQNAFIGCASLTNAVIGNGVKKIGVDAFGSCYNLSCVVIPEGVVTLGEGCFAALHRLTSISFPSSVLSIEKNAFYSCTNLTGVALGSGLTNVNCYAFYCCPRLETISVHADNPVFCSDNGVLFNKDRTEVLICPEGKTGCVLPEGVTRIGLLAFKRCEKLASVTLPASVTNIGDYALCNCSLLKEVIFQGNLPAAGTGVFGSSPDV